METSFHRYIKINQSIVRLIGQKSNIKAQNIFLAVFMYLYV